jgi:hypothetical protein
MREVCQGSLTTEEKDIFGYGHFQQSYPIERGNWFNRLDATINRVNSRKYPSGNIRQWSSQYDKAIHLPIS